jgi:predicted metal-dependent hydrolase
MILASVPYLGTMHKPCRANLPMKKRPANGVDASVAAPAADGPLGGLAVEIVRSSRRRRTISATLNGSRLVVRVPAGMAPADERAAAEKLGARILAARRRRELNDDAALMARTRVLNERYFGGRLTIRDVRYVTNQQNRFGSCTPSRGTIRVSDRVAKLPAWVRDAVLVHELAHLVEGNHSARFWRLANAYPLMERARGYLMAVGLEDEEGER